MIIKALNLLIVYRNLLKDSVISALLDFDLKRDRCTYCTFLSELAKTGLTLKEHIINLITYDVNSFTKGEFKDWVWECVKSDLAILNGIANLTSSALKDIISDEETGDLPDFDDVPELKVEDIVNRNTQDISDVLWFSDNWTDEIEKLESYYNINGYGIYSKYKAFIWTGSLTCVSEPDPVRLSDLIDYESERGEIIKNTEYFLKNYPANNMLLYGDRGTGKSTCVKAVLNEFSGRGLRLIEVPVSRLNELPKIISLIKNVPLKFIFFIDDIAFENNADSYTYLKAILEGGIESRPKNAIIYATTNRRNLIKETFSERNGMFSGNQDDEVNASDSIQEKRSLSDRFGIRVTFISPSQQQYFKIVEGILIKRGIHLDGEYIKAEAIKWETLHGGRSPRIAKQLADMIECKVRDNEI